MGSVVAFGVGSALAGVAWSVGSLIAFRVLQGVGGGAILPDGATCSTQAAGLRRLGRVTAVVSVPAQIAPIAGLLVGGLVVQAVSWRWCFFLNVPLCLLAAALAHRAVPAVPGEPAQRLDVRGLAMLAPALGALTYGLSRAGTAGFGEPAVLGLIASGAGLLAASSSTPYGWMPRSSTCGSSRSARSPERRRCSSCSARSLFGSLVIVPLYVQQVWGAGALAAGLAWAPQFAGTLVALTSWLADEPQPVATAAAAMRMQVRERMTTSVRVEMTPLRPVHAPSDTRNVPSAPDAR